MLQESLLRSVGIHRRHQRPWRCFTSNTNARHLSGRPAKTPESRDGAVRAARDQISVIAHPVSKLRLFNLATRPDESVRERALRQKRMELQAWNHAYWTANNAEFNQLKKSFVKNELNSRNRETKEELLRNGNRSHEELALFYKRFLDANKAKHIAYNFEWYRRNVSLLWPSFLVRLERLFRR